MNDAAKARVRACVSVRTEDIVAEMIVDDHDVGFMVFEDGAARRESHLETPLGNVVPYSRQNTLLTHDVVLFPSDSEPFSDRASLLRDVRHFIHSYVDVSPPFEELASWYVLMTWVYDDFSELPYLRVRGDYGCGKSRFLQTVGSIAYKPMFASGASSTSPLFRIIDAMRGTLVLDESDFRFSDERADIIKILNNGNAAGFPVLRSEQKRTGEYTPRAFHVYGPKIIASRRSFDDEALESRCVTEDLMPKTVRPDIPLSLPKAFNEEARRLRNKLLCFRFMELGRPRAPLLEDSLSLEPRTRQLLEPLLQMNGTKSGIDLVQSIGNLKTREIQRSRSSRLQKAIAEILLEHLEKEALPVSLGSLAKSVGDTLGIDISARRVGSCVRSLGFQSVRRQGVFVITNEEADRIKMIAERYGVSGDKGDVGDVVLGAA